MKHIKLFEQFEEDSWWEEESPFDNIEDNSNELKDGDWVICIDAHKCSFIKEGEKYQISRISEYDSDMVFLFGVGGVWYKSRFKKIEPPKTNEEYKLFKADYRKTWDLSGNVKSNRNKRDIKEPFFIGKNKKDYKFEKDLKNFLNTKFSPYLTYDKYLIYKKKLEESGYDVILEDFNDSFAADVDFLRWTINSKVRIYFLIPQRYLALYYKLKDQESSKEIKFPIDKLNRAIEFLVDLKIPEEERRKKKEALKLKYRNVDPFDEEIWEIE